MARIQDKPDICFRQILPRVAAAPTTGWCRAAVADAAAAGDLPPRVEMIDTATPRSRPCGTSCASAPAPSASRALLPRAIVDPAERAWPRPRAHDPPALRSTFSAGRNPEVDVAIRSRIHLVEPGVWRPEALMATCLCRSAGARQLGWTGSAADLGVCLLPRLRRAGLGAGRMARALQDQRPRKADHNGSMRAVRGRRSGFIGPTCRRDRSRRRAN